MGALEEQLLNVNVVLISAGAWFILWVLRKVWKGMDSIQWVKKFKPLYPAILCQGFVWIPGALPIDPEPTIGSRILMGLWCGFLASIGYQMIKRLLGQRGIELPDKPEDLLPTSDKEGDKPEPDEDDKKSKGGDKSEDSESRDTPVETPVPRDAKDASEDAAGETEDVKVD